MIDLDDFRPELIYPYDPRYTPQPPPTVDVCAGPVVNICMNAEWWAHVSGMITRLAYRDAWTGTEDEVHAAIESIYKILDVGKPTMSCGCGCEDKPNRTRVTPDGGYEVSYDGGETWQDGSDLDPRYTAPQLPPLSGDDGDEKKCIAANNVLGQFKDGIAAFSGYFDTTTTVIGFVTAAAGFIAAVIFAPLAIPIIVGIIIALLSAIAVGGKTAYDAAFNETVYGDLLCILFCNVQNDGTFTADNFSAIRAGISSHFDPIARDAFLALLQGVSLAGLNNLAKIPTGSSTNCDSCGCNDFCGTDWVIVDDRQDLPTYDSEAKTISGPATLIAGNYYWGVKVAYPACCTVSAEITGSVVAKFRAACDYTGELSLDEGTGWTAEGLNINGNYRGVLIRSSSPFSVVLTFAD